MAHDLKSETSNAWKFDGAGVDDAPIPARDQIGLENNPNIDGGKNPPSICDPVVALIQHAATNLDAPPRYHATNVVVCLSGKLSRIIWQGEQWAVTAYGIEARDGTYTITKHRLWEDEGHHGWVEHMSGKGWVDLIDFAEALRIARQRHAPINPQG
jgi:hypothetical protein